MTGRHTNQESPVMAQFNMTAMHKSAKEFIDAYNRRINQAKALGEVLKNGSGQELKPIHSNARATVHAIITVYVRQLNKSLMATLACDEALPGFKTTVGSMRGMKGCSDRTIQNHKNRLQLAGVIVEECSLGKTGTEIFFHHEIVFSRQPDQIQEYFTNHTFYPGLTAHQVTATEAPDFSGNITGNFNAEKAAESSENTHFSDVAPNADGEIFSPFNAGTSRTNKIENRPVHKSGVPSEQGDNQEQGIKNLGAAAQFGPSSQAQTPASPEVPEKKAPGGPGGGARLKAKILGRAHIGEPENSHPLRKDEVNAGSLSTLFERELQFITAYGLKRLYADTIFNGIEVDKIASLIRETAFWDFKTISTEKQLARHSKMLRERIDWAADWYHNHPHIIPPPAHLYFSPLRKMTFSFARTYNWWVKNEGRRAISEVKRDVTLHRKGKGRFKHHTLTHLYRIHESRIAAMELPPVLETFYKLSDLIYRTRTES